MSLDEREDLIAMTEHDGQGWVDDVDEQHALDISLLAPAPGEEGLTLSHEGGEYEILRDIDNLCRSSKR